MGAQLLGLRTPQADQGCPQERRRCRPRSGRPTDAWHGDPRCEPLQEAVHDQSRPGRSARTRSGQTRLHRDSAGPQVGRRLHVLLDVVRDRLCRVRRRRLLAPHRRLESRPHHARHVGHRRVEHGRLDPSPQRSRRRDLSLRCRIAIHLNRVHRPSRRHQRSTIDRHHRGLLRL